MDYLKDRSTKFLSQIYDTGSHFSCFKGLKNSGIWVKSCALQQCSRVWCTCAATSCIPLLLPSLKCSLLPTGLPGPGIKPRTRRASSLLYPENKLPLSPWSPYYCSLCRDHPLQHPNSRLPNRSQGAAGQKSELQTHWRLRLLGPGQMRGVQPSCGPAQHSRFLILGHRGHSTSS